MMEEELAALKRTLISLVVSSPTTMTVNSLVKDYRNMVGGMLPVNKFGYRDYVKFLKERCTDIFVVEGPSWDPVLTPKVTKNLKHIDQMVQKQKVQSTSKHKGKRRSVPGFINPPVQRNLVSETFCKTSQSTLPTSYKKPQDYKERTPPQTTEPQVTQMKESKVNGTTQEHNVHVDRSPDCNGNGDSIKENYDNNNRSESPSRALTKFYKKRLPQYNSDLDFPGPNADRTSKGSNDSGSHSSTSQTSSTKVRLLEELKNEIVELVKDSPEGVWFTDLIKLYKDMYGRELNLSRVGLTSSLGNLVGSLQDRVAVTRPDPRGDYLLRDPSATSAVAAPGAYRGRGAGPTLAARRLARPAPAREPATDPDDALPGIEFEADVYPEDCMHYMESIPASSARELATGAQFEALVGEVYSPSHFWMLRLDAAHSIAMEDIMDEMNEYYARGEGAARALARGARRVGHYCAALFERDWHRALIVQLLDSDTVKVRHVDYGTVCSVQADALRPLRRQWGALPAQAVRARLAGLRPCARGERWPRAACAAFLAAVRDRRLYANVAAVHDEEDIVETFLTDTSGPADVCLTRELIRLGHADARLDSALAADESYLYPRFHALETAATPNYADICALLAAGLAPDYVDAYRRHVPALRLSDPGPEPAPSPPQEEEPQTSPVEEHPFSQSQLMHPSLLHTQSMRHSFSQSQTEESDSMYPSLSQSQLVPQSLYSQSMHTTHLQAIDSDPLQMQSVHPSPLQSQSMHPSPLQSQSMHPSPLQSQSIHSSPLQSKSMHPSPFQSQSMHPSPLQSLSMHPSPLQSQSMHPSPLQSQSMHPSPPQSQSMHSTQLQTQSMHPIQSQLQSMPPPGMMHPQSYRQPMQPRTQSHTRAPPLPTPMPTPPPIRPSLMPTPARPSLLPTPARPSLMPTLPVRPSLLPTPVAAEASDEVRLTEEEWGVLAHLRATDPGAADWYLVVAGWRALQHRNYLQAPSVPPGF